MRQKRIKATTLEAYKSPIRGSCTENSAVRVEELTVSYGPLVAVEAISFTVKNGEICGLLGPNGAGKTSTIKVLVGVLEPRPRNVEIFETPIIDEAAEKVRSATFPEDVVLLDSLTPREFLEFVASIRRLESSTVNPIKNLPKR